MTRQQKLSLNHSEGSAAYLRIFVFSNKDIRFKIEIVKKEFNELF